MGKEERRRNRKHVLEALESETGSLGGGDAEPRVRAYCKDPEGAPTTEFGYVGGLRLSRFYVDPAKPNSAERRSLWTEIMSRLEKDADDPGGWGGSADVKQLHAIAEEA